ncbi:hypothetical protein F5Y19DRAFT_491730 [Xylariaceae sp. FL1651]|nr:hypothetical protein F5Y19DRAFT_491730 [Xylariaceae sp. FL1651]
MHTSFLTAVTTLAASVAAAPHVARQTVYATWPATNVVDDIAHILVGLSFDITSPAGYVAGAPAFDVACSNTLLDQGPTACTFNGPQAAGSSVEALYNTNGTVTVTHTFKTSSGGTTKVWGNSPYLGDSYNEDFAVEATYLQSS